MTKAPIPTEMSKRQSDNTNNATKKFDYTVVAERLRTVSWSNYDHPTGVVNLVYGPNLSKIFKRLGRRLYVKVIITRTTMYMFCVLPFLQPCSFLSKMVSI